MSETTPELRLYNTLTRSKEVFKPLDERNVRMYVCGPTVYDYAHIGNARPAIVFDMLFRLLLHVYGDEHVTYVRNITDVDDKINARALRDYGEDIAAGRLGLNEAIRKVTEPTYDQYQRDVAALGCLEPTHQPRATDYVVPRADGQSDMVTLIQALLDKGHAYAAAGEILFDTASMPDYGRLSKRPLDEQQAGARVAVDAHKKNPADFVLWKSSSDVEPGWDATFTVDARPLAIRGRPGWHIECSAMSEALLWDLAKDRLSPDAQAHPHQFDIHGGGLDLIFPHHENEIAQSRCAHGSAAMAQVWMHNGFVQVEGRKMSKSEGNFVTIHDLLHTDKFGGRSWPGEVLRLAMLMTHYREPIDFSVRRLEEALQEWVGFGRVVREHLGAPEIDATSVDLVLNDLATPDLLTRLRTLRAESIDSQASGRRLTGTLRLLGLFENSFPIKMQVITSLPVQDLEIDHFLYENSGLSNDVYIAALVEHMDGRYPAEARGLISNLRKLPDGMTIKDVVRLKEIGISPSSLLAMRDGRLTLIREKKWPEADKIRDELLAQGIQLKDGKDPATGERFTTWEVKR